MLFVAVASFVAGTLVSVLPAIAYARSRPAIDDLRSAASTARAGFSLLRSGRSRAALVVIEVALAMVLLVGGGLMIHSFARLSSVRPGFDPANVITFQIALPADRYPLPRLKTFADGVVDRLQGASGVVAAAHGQPPMVMLTDSFGVSRRTGATRRPGNDAVMVRLVSADYSRTMGIAVTRGHGFTNEDGQRSTRVVLINEMLAQRDFAGEDPIGARIFFGPDDMPWKVVGVTADVRLYGFDRAPTAQVFALPSQWPGDNVFPLGPYFAVKTHGDRSALLRQVREIALALEPESGVFNAATMENIVSNRMAQPRLYTVLLGTFASLAAVLAFVGVYGVLSYVVTQRTREIGIRMALGATPIRVLRTVLSQSLAVAAFGIVIGLAGAVTLSRVLQGLLFGVEPVDAITYAVVTLVFVLVLMVAAWLPSRRATRIVPVEALRAE